MKSIYLAGPDVFFPEFEELIREKARLVREHGFLPLYAGVIEYPELADRHKTGLAISAVNELLMRGADLLIANLTPFRGIAADTGTVFEIGFMAALGRPIFAYTNSPVDHRIRILTHYGQHHLDVGHVERGADGSMMENFDMVDNLMIDGAIENRGGTIIRNATGTDPLSANLSAFRLCLDLAVAACGASSG